MSSSSLRRAALGALAAAVLAVALAACGSSSKGPPTVNWYVFPEPSGSFAKAADECTKAANGAYKIKINLLPNDSDSQRTQLVRRLAAKDSSIDIVAMDVDWTAEFADAKWIRPWTGAIAKKVTDGVLAGPIATATWKGTLYAAPLNSNTQLLWYRKDLVSQAPDDLGRDIDDAIALAKQGKPHYIEEQGAQYEGLVVWFNSLVELGGRLDPEGRQHGHRRSPQRRPRRRSCTAWPTSVAADPSLNTAKEDPARLAFESGTAAFQINYPYVWPAAQKDVPKIFKNMGYAPFPASSPACRPG